MKRQVFDQAFKQMAVVLSYAKGSVKLRAAELGIEPGRLSKCGRLSKITMQLRLGSPALGNISLEQHQFYLEKRSMAARKNPSNKLLQFHKRPAH